MSSMDFHFRQSDLPILFCKFTHFDILFRHFDMFKNVKTLKPVYSSKNNSKQNLRQFKFSRVVGNSEAEERKRRIVFES